MWGWEVGSLQSLALLLGLMQSWQAEQSVRRLWLMSARTLPPQLSQHLHLRRAVGMPLAVLLPRSVHALLMCCECWPVDQPSETQLHWQWVPRWLTLDSAWGSWLRGGAEEAGQ